mgnify:CR=1 FL=1
MLAAETHAMQLTIDVLGWAGAVLVLVAYFLVSSRRASGEAS